MLVRNVMNRKVVIAKPEVTLREASKVMSDLDIGCLVVVKKEKIIGIVTSTDILKSIASGKDPDTVLVEQIMSAPVRTIDSDKTIEDAVDVMMKHKIKKLPVVDDEKLIGLITTTDIMAVEPKLIATIADLMSLKLPGYSGG